MESSRRLRARPALSGDYIIVVGAMRMGAGAEHVIRRGWSERQIVCDTLYCMLYRLPPLPPISHAFSCRRSHRSPDPPTPTHSGETRAWKSRAGRSCDPCPRTRVGGRTSARAGELVYRMRCGRAGPRTKTAAPSNVHHNQPRSCTTCG
jgi:hypothetical protein